MTRSSAVPAFLMAMAFIPAGKYTPLFRDSRKAPKTKPVAAFRMDRDPVTVSDYVSFLRNHPRWRRSKIPRIFADPTYLRSWRSDLDPGRAANPDAPVTNVSWFAANAYCRSRGKRLPSLDQWEYAASPEAFRPGLPIALARQKILELDTRKLGNPLPAVGSTPANRWGVRDLHGLVWEWVSDFSSSFPIDRSAVCAAASLGANSLSDYSAFMRFAFRESLTAQSTTEKLGFRCAQNLSPGASA